MNLSYKNRIAFYYMLASAMIMAIVFGAIFFIVQEAVMRNLDNDLSYEANKHTEEVKIINENIKFKNKAEWEEREHSEIQVNPVFIQLTDKKGFITDKSPNLKEDSLPFKQTDFGGHFDAQLKERSIRQVQLPIEQNGKIKGYIVAAMSSESARSVIQKLRNVLLISYLIVLVVLYFTSRFLAGRSIKPVQNITETITRITKNNLKDRVALPTNLDEIHHLSTSFNSLLERIELAIEREKQFTSDASHELRTPLASLRGTLEVLIRKPRTQAEYEDKIQFSLKEIDSMTAMLEQLLLLARLDSNDLAKKAKLIELPTIIDETLSLYQNQINNKGLTVDFHFDPAEKLLVPQYYSSLIINNVVGNAIKYAKNETPIKIKIEQINKKVVCSIQDEGIGIKEEDLLHIYENFFRSEALNHKQIAGNGLGMSIVKKCAEAIGAEIDLKSKLGTGTTLTITF